MPDQQTESVFSKINQFVLRLNRITTVDKLLFIQELGVMLKAAVPIDRILQSIAQDTKNPHFQMIIQNICSDIQGGASLSDSLAKHQNVFGEVLVSMVRAGEASGNLDQTLGFLYKQIKKDHDIVSKAKGALIYPSFILMTIIGIVSFLMIKVVPQLVSIFAGAKIQLPLATRILQTTSYFMVEHTKLIFLGVIVFIVMFMIIMRTYRGKYIMHTIQLHLPVIGMIVKKVNIARFSRTMSTLLRTDMSIVQDLEITARTLGSLPYKVSINAMAEKVKEGATLEEGVKSVPPVLFSNVVIQLISVGEGSGALDSVLDELASFYEDEVTQVMNNLPALIEPILILVLGSVVGGIAVAIILPIYTILQNTE